MEIQGAANVSTANDRKQFQSSAPEPEVKRISDYFPAFYQSLLPEIFFCPIPQESLATCGNCVMCSEQAFSTPVDSELYNPNTKCCTYYPTLPNYLVGGLLADNESCHDEGRRRLLEIIRKRSGVSPLAVAMPPWYRLLYENNHGAFGRSERLLCPFYLGESGLCSLWKFRNSICFSYFCRHQAGLTGFQFWNGVRDYMVEVESILACLALRKLGFKDLDLNRNPLGQKRSAPVTGLSGKELDGSVDLDLYRRDWGRWEGNEEALFIETWRIVSHLNREDLQKAMGVHQQIRLDRLTQLHGVMTDQNLPSRLKRNPNIEVKYMDEKVVALPYKMGGFLEMDRVVFDALSHFNGTRSLDEVNQGLVERLNLALDVSLIRALWRNEILIDVHSI